MRHVGLRVVVAVGLLAAGCSTADVDVSRVSAGAAASCARTFHVAYDAIVCADGRAPIKLSHRPTAPVFGSLAPTGITSPDTKALLYNSWEPGQDWSNYQPEACERTTPREAALCPRKDATDQLGTPVLRIANLSRCDRTTDDKASCSEDELFERGASSAAWKSDDAIAYFKGQSDEVLADVSSWVGDIWARTRGSNSSSAVRWTAGSGRYVVLAWLGDRLLAYERLPNSEKSDVVIFDQPGKKRRLAERASVVAISPDGSLILLNTDGRSRLDVRRVDSGSVVSAAAASALATEAGVDESLRFVMYGGSWRGNLIVAETGAGIGLWEWSGTTLTFKRLIKTGLEQQAYGQSDPTFLDDGTVAVRAMIPADNASSNAARFADAGKSDLAYVPVVCSTSGECSKKRGMNTRYAALATNLSKTN